MLPVSVPTLVASGPGWILMEDVGGKPRCTGRRRAARGTAPMHELLGGATGIDHERFRDVFGREREGLLALARGSANAAALPEPLASLLDDPSPLDAFVDADPRTFVHGDAWPGNVLMRGKDFVWLDWTGPARDLPRTTCRCGSTAPRGRRVRRALRERSAPTWRPARRRWSPSGSSARWTRCTILGFLLTQLARLTDREPDLIERVIERRNLIAIGLLD